MFVANADRMEVIGIDFSPLMNPDDIPENLHLQVRLTNSFAICSSSAKTTCCSRTWSCIMRLGRFRSCDILSLCSQHLQPFPVCAENKKNKTTTDKLIE